jgi:ribonuclease HII
VSCSFEQEDLLAARGILRVAGIDEAGRGPLAGPVVAAAVVLPRSFPCGELNDSKKLTARKRSVLFERIIGDGEVAWSISSRDHAAIDRLNILRATHEAMREAFLGVTPSADHALIDGLPVRDFPSPQTSLVGGDARSLSIAAASILAKVTRDRLMEELDDLYPEYGFRQHKGYPTREHLAKLRAHGPCPVHRRSFAPVAQTEFL